MSQIGLKPHKARIPDALHASPEEEDSWGDRGDASTIEAESDFQECYRSSV